MATYSSDLLQINHSKLRLGHLQATVKFVLSSLGQSINDGAIELPVAQPTEGLLAG